MSSTEERYIRAAKSSHLKADEHAGDIDTVIGSGSSAEGLAASLLRLRGEYDAMRSELDLHTQNTSDRDAAASTANELARRSKDSGQALAALALQYAAESEGLTEHLLILVNMKSLRGATLLLWNFVREKAAEGGHAPEDFDTITSKVMQAFLAPRCRNCGGRGFKGGYLRPATRCNACEHTGRVEIDWEGFDRIGQGILYRVELKVENWRRHVASRTRNG